VPGTTTLSTLTDSGKLVMAAGDLTTSGNLSTAGYTQTGGLLNVEGMLSITSTAGAMTLGNIDAGTLSVTSKTGAITQLAGTALDVTGASSLTAYTGLTGPSAVEYDITLANTKNNFVGAVTTNGADINLADGTGGITLGNTTATGILGNPGTGTLTVNSLNGTIKQAIGAAIDANGTSSLTADNGVKGLGDIKYNVTLANAGNNFVSAVNLNGLNINLTDATGGMTLGNTTATGTLTVTSRGAAIRQLTGTSIKVSGASSLTGDNGVSGAGDVKYNIALANTTNRFGGAVTAVGSTIALYDTAALTAALTSAGAVSLTSAGPLFVSGTVGTNLTTVTTGGIGSTTTFGNTTVGKFLQVTSTGAVTEALGDELLVHGAGTDATDPVNTYVTVNGKKGAHIQ
jgi:hypothetical protein